jgi:predicted Zn-dependent peptidase
MSKELGEDVLTYQERLAQLKDITLADIQEHYGRTHTAGNMRFVVAGDFEGNPTTITKLLEQWQLPEGERLPIPVDEMHSAEPFIIRRKDAPNITFGWSMVVSRRLSDEESDAMDCLNHILTGTLHSRIFGEARKKGLVYHMFSDTSAFEHNSSWDIGAQANEDNLDDVIDIIVKEMKKILAGDLDDKDIEAAKSYALGRHQMGAQTAGQINSWYANRYFFDGKIEDFDTQTDTINAVTKDQIIDTARQFFAAKCWTLGGYGNGDKAMIERLAAKLKPLFE